MIQATLTFQALRRYVFVSSKLHLSYFRVQPKSPIGEINDDDFGGVGMVQYCDETTHLLPMSPRFQSQTRHYMGVDLVVGFCPCSKGVSPGSPVSLPLQKKQHSPKTIHSLILLFQQTLNFGIHSTKLTKMGNHKAGCGY